jgi:hypothetical protein
MKSISLSRLRRSGDAEFRQAIVAGLWLATLLVPVVALAVDSDRPIPQDPEKARQARLESNACRAKQLWLEPKWHGSPEDMLAFGQASRDTRNWQAGITLLLPQTHHRLTEY